MSFLPMSVPDDNLDQYSNSINNIQQQQQQQQQQEQQYNNLLYQQIQEWILQLYNNNPMIAKEQQRYIIQSLQHHLSSVDTILQLLIYITTTSSTTTTTNQSSQSSTSLSFENRYKIQFYLLSTIQQYHYLTSCTIQQRYQLRQYLLHTILLLVPHDYYSNNNQNDNNNTNTNHTTTTTQKSTIVLPSYLRNKAATIVSTLLIQDMAFHQQVSSQLQQSEHCNSNMNDITTRNQYNNSNNNDEGIKRRNWDTVYTDLIVNLRQHHHEIYLLQILVYVFEDIILYNINNNNNNNSTAIDNDNDNNNENEANDNNNNNSDRDGTISSSVSIGHTTTTATNTKRIPILTNNDIRQFKDIIKGYGNTSNISNNNTSNPKSTTNTNATTLLQLFYQTVVEIYHTTYYTMIRSSDNNNNNNNNNINTTTTNGTQQQQQQPITTIIVLCNKVMRNIFLWTTIQYINPSIHIVQQMIQLQINTIQYWFIQQQQQEQQHEEQLQDQNQDQYYEIIKGIFMVWKELVTSCDMLPQPQSTTTIMNNDSRHNDLLVIVASTIQHLSDTKIPILHRILVDCIVPIATTMLPPLPVNGTKNSNNSNHKNIDDNKDDDGSSISSELMEVIIELSSLINIIGIEIIPLYEQHILSSPYNNNNSNGNGNNNNNHSDPQQVQIFQYIFQQIYDVAIRAYGYDDIDVTTAILPFITQLIYYMHEPDDDDNDDANTITTSSTSSDRNNRNTSNNNSSVSKSMFHHVPLLLRILYQQMKYPNDFSYDYNSDDDDDDDDAAEEIMFRTELCQVYKKFITVAPNTCLNFIHDALHSIVTTTTTTIVDASQNMNINLAMASTSDVEAILRLIFVYCEAIRPSPGVKIVLQNSTFISILTIVHNSNIVLHPHREVLCLYYEMAIRYYLFYLLPNQTNEPLLSKLLNAMTGTCGLQHIHPRVRSRCCYLFLRLVQVTIKLLRPFVEIAITGILNLLSNTNLQLRPDDTLYLFETIGLLLGKTGLDTPTQVQYLTAIITPHVRNIDSTLSSINQHTSTTNNNTISDITDEIIETNVDLLCNSIAAITNLSKGITNPSNDVAMVLMETLNITLTVLQTLPNRDQIRNKAMVLVQRMIVCVGSNVLILIPSLLQQLIPWSTYDDILFVAQIFNQVCIKFKQNAISALDHALIPFLQKCESLVPSTHNVDMNANSQDPNHNTIMIPPHLKTEQLVIRKLSFVVLQHIVIHKVTAILFTITNASHLETILRLMHDGIISVSDPIVKKTCIRFFRSLIEQMNTVVSITENNPNQQYQYGILSFLGQTVLPDTLLCIINTSSSNTGTKNGKKHVYLSDANSIRVLSELGQLIYTYRSICIEIISAATTIATRTTETTNTFSIMYQDFVHTLIQKLLLQQQVNNYANNKNNKNNTSNIDPHPHQYSNNPSSIPIHRLQNILLLPTIIASTQHQQEVQSTTTTTGIITANDIVSCLQDILKEIS